MADKTQIIVGACLSKKLGTHSIFAGRHSLSRTSGEDFDYATVSQNQEGNGMLELVYKNKCDNDKPMPELQEIAELVGRLQLDYEGMETLADYIDFSAGTTTHRHTGEEVLAVRLIEKPSQNYEIKNYEINFVACSKSLDHVI